MTETSKLRILALVLVIICVSIAGCKKDKPVQDPDPGETKTPIDNSLLGGGGNEDITDPPEDPLAGSDTISPVEPDIAPVRVLLETSKGDILLELNAKEAPVTVTNFVRYVEEGFYDGTIFHRVLKGTIIQGGGILPDMTAKTPHAPILNEASNGLKNKKGTIAMARTLLPDSATSQFFINHNDNPALDHNSPQSPDGYAVFGKVVQGMDVVDALASVPTTTSPSGEKSLPLQPILLKKAKVLSAG